MNKRIPIKFVVFDFGGVICEFKFAEYFQSLGYGQEDIDFIKDKIFNGTIWQREMDCGLICWEQAHEKLCEKYPDKKHLVDVLFDTDPKYFTPLRLEVLEYIKELRKSGFKVYGLTNLSEHMHNYCRRAYPGFDELFDGITASYMVNALKPASKNPDDSDYFSTKIYKRFFVDNCLSPSKCLFIDDNKCNLHVGDRFGMRWIEWRKGDTPGTLIKRLNEKWFFR